MPIHSYTLGLTNEQVGVLKSVLERSGFDFMEKPYSIYAAKKDKLSVTVYEKGPKVLVQGKGTEDFVTFHLEPEVVGEAKLGYEEVNNPEMFEPHFGIDESGKGDFFGPLVIAGAFVDAGVARALMNAGVQDSKKIGSDNRIRVLAEAIRGVRGVVFDVIRISPAKYNDLYDKIGNLNRLLAWGHARVIENLCIRKPDCPRALSDQFANPAQLERALQEKGRGIRLEQKTKAESDVAVAAASILARESFINWLRDTSKELGTDLPKGASAAVKKAARELISQKSAANLRNYAKTHFKTASELVEN